MLISGAVAVVVGLLSTGAVAGGGLVDPGAVVRWGLPLVTVVTYVATAFTIGAFGAAAFLVSPVAEPGAWKRLTTFGSVSAGVWAVFQVLHVVFGYASVWGRPLTAENFGSEILVFVRGTELGTAYAWAAGLAVVVSLFAVATTGLNMAMWTTALGAIALVPIALTGHAAGAVAHNLAVSAMWLHLVPVALWLGGLAALAVAFPVLGTQRVPAVTRFSTLAVWAFVFTAASGVLAAAIRLSSPLDLFTTTWGRLLLAKVVAFAALGAMGWWHRRRTIPQLDTRPLLFWRVALVELAVMGAVAGIAVALSSSAPPVPQDPVVDPSAVFALTGYSEPPYPTAATWFTQWHPDPLYLLGGGSAIFVYLKWTWKMRRAGGTGWPWWRAVVWTLGWLVFIWVTCGGPYVYGAVLFSAHMVMHMILVMAIPILWVLAAPITALVRAIPPRRDGSRGPREWTLALVHSWWARLWGSPIMAGVNFAGSLFLFYYTQLLPLALTYHVGHVLMVVHFSLAGYLFANAVIGVDPGLERAAYPVRLLLLFSAMVFHAFFGLSIANYDGLLAAQYYGHLGLSWWVDALADQHQGGFVTWGIGEGPTLILAIIMAVLWVRSDEREARRLDRAADRDGDSALEEYNRMLAARAQEDH